MALPLVIENIAPGELLEKNKFNEDMVGRGVRLQMSSGRAADPGF